MSIKSQFATFAGTRKTSYVIVKKRRKFPKMSLNAAPNGCKSLPIVTSMRWIRSGNPRNWRFWRSKFDQDSRPLLLFTGEKRCAVADYDKEIGRASCRERV